VANVSLRSLRLEIMTLENRELITGINLTFSDFSRIARPVERLAAPEIVAGEGLKDLLNEALVWLLFS
jgi:hypothetical protein